MQTCMHEKCCNIFLLGDNKILKTKISDIFKTKFRFLVLSMFCFDVLH